MTYTLRHPAYENLRHPATAYKTGIIQVVQPRPGDQLHFFSAVVQCL